MNVQLPLQMDQQAFLAWVQGREERYELDRGRVIMIRGPKGFAPGADVLKGEDAVIHIESLGIDLPFAEVYNRVRLT